MSGMVIAPPDREDVVVLIGNRHLAVYEWGPVDGIPVLFCSGAGMSGSLGFGAEAVYEQDIRLIAIDRPGLGRSAPDPHKSFATWIADVEQLLLLADIGRPAVVGFSQGAPFALALAAADLVNAAAIVSGQDELAHPVFTAALDPALSDVIAQAQSDPTAFEQHVSHTATAEWLWNMISDMSSPEDQAFYGSPAFSSAYRQSLNEGLAQGAAGYARDLVLAIQRWPFRVEDVRTPVQLWFGGKDSSPVHSPDYGATLQQRLAVSSRTVDPELGSAILWKRSADILKHLLG